MLDALIGNTDRHHENWGILVRRGRGVLLGEVAPSFDHASSLGRELRDIGPGRTRQRMLKEHLIGAYSERARGARPEPLGTREACAQGVSQGICWRAREIKRRACRRVEDMRRTGPRFVDEQYI